MVGEIGCYCGGRLIRFIGLLQMPTAFRTFVKDVIQILGSPSNQAEQMATEIFSFEKRIAEITPDPLGLRDPVQALNKVTVGQLRSQSSTVSSNFCKALKVYSVQSRVIYERVDTRRFCSVESTGGFGINGVSAICEVGN